MGNNGIPVLGGLLYGVDWKLNRILKRCLSHGIIKVTREGGLFTEVLFGDLQTVYEFWDCDRYWGWLKFGTFRDVSGNELYSYSGARPTRRTMRRMLDELRRYWRVMPSRDYVVRRDTPSGDVLSILERRGEITVLHSERPRRTGFENGSEDNSKTQCYE